MASNIDTTKPAAGSATTLSVRENFAAAKSEIEALQALSKAIYGVIYKTGASQTVPTGAAATVVEFDSAPSGPLAQYWDGVNYCWDVAAAAADGWVSWSAIVHLDWAANATGSRKVRIHDELENILNGMGTVPEAGTAHTTPTMPTEWHEIGTTQQLFAIAGQSSGGNLDILASVVPPSFFQLMLSK